MRTGPGLLLLAVVLLTACSAPAESGRAAFRTVSGPPVMEFGAMEPFEWTVALSPGDEGLWCVNASVGGPLGDAVGTPCDQLVLPAGPAGDEVFGNVSVEEHGDDSGAIVRGVRYGAVDESIDEVVVAFDDGSRRVAELEEANGVGFNVWAIAYQDGGSPTQIEARRSGSTVAVRATPAGE